jgi:hypothetical protein
MLLPFEKVNAHVNAISESTRQEYGHTVPESETILFFYHGLVSMALISQQGVAVMDPIDTIARIGLTAEVSDNLRTVFPQDPADDIWVFIDHYFRTLPSVTGEGTEES